MKKTNLIMRIVPIAVFAAIVVYLAVYIIRAVDDPFSTATATLYTVYDSVETRGVVVREEECIIYPGGMVSISAEDGSRVAAGGEIAAVYSSEEDIRKAERAAFLASQAGILARDLQPGKPCPVCGSTEHPHPAPLKEGAFTKEDVDRAEAE